MPLVTCVADIYLYQTMNALCLDEVRTLSTPMKPNSWADVAKHLNIAASLEQIIVDPNTSMWLQSAPSLYPASIFIVETLAGTTSRVTMSLSGFGQRATFLYYVKYYSGGSVHDAMCQLADIPK